MRLFLRQRVGGATPHRSRLTTLQRCEATCSSQWRSYSATPPWLKGQGPAFPSSRPMGMWLAPDANALENQPLWEHLPSLDHANYAHIRKAVFLATPKFAHLLEEGSQFLASAMSSIFARAKSLPDQAPITSVVGIVDQLPGAVTGVSSPTGAEGIAYLLAPASDHETEPVGKAQQDSYPSLLRFYLRTGQLHDYQPTTGLVPFAKGRGSVYVPLANTIFVNGRRSTLIETVWNKDTDALVPGFSSPVSVLHIPLRRAVNHALRFGIPLMEITPERIVKSAMGNILRQVGLDGNAVPASKELEAAVVRSPFPSHSDGRRPRVYAQIKPPWLSTFESGPSPASLFAGIGLYHVTGGGGGWGQKQGLLSLDPTRTYSPPSDSPLALDSELPNDDDVENVFRRDEDLVKPGDSVQFFREITESDEHDVRAAELLQRLNWDAQDGAKRLLIGAVPSKPDGSNGANDSQASATSSAIHVPNTFGALSELGFALEFDGAKFMRGGNAAEGEINTPETIHTECKVEVANAWLGVELGVSWRARRERNARRAKFAGRNVVIDTAVPTGDSPPPSTEDQGSEEKREATTAQQGPGPKAQKQGKGTPLKRDLIRKVKLQDKSTPARRETVRKSEQKEETTPTQENRSRKGNQKHNAAPTQGILIRKHAVKDSRSEG